MEITKRRGLPGGRAVLGGLLIAVAVVGVFAAYSRADRRPTQPVAVAARDLRVGDVLEPGDLRTVDVDLPDGGGRTFESASDLAGHVVLGPVAEGEIVQAGSVTDQRSMPDVHEIALHLPRGQIAAGRLKAGERVDVFVTYDDRTTSVVRGAAVVDLDVGEGGSLTSDREVTLVVAVPTGDAVAALVHALRTGDVTVVRSTFSEATATDPLEHTSEDDAAPSNDDEEEEG